MSGSENLVRPSADLAREKTEAAISASKQNRKTNVLDRAKNEKGTEEKCEAVKGSASFENEIGNVSPNATNLSR